MKKQKKYNLKNSILLLLLLLVFLIMSTYAWFTSNTLVKVESMNVNVAASTGFQISLDGMNWKSVINAQDFLNAITTYPVTNGNTNHIGDSMEETGGVMKPVSTAFVREDTDPDALGYLQMFVGEVRTNDAGDYVLTSSQITETPTTSEFIAFDLFFRASNPSGTAIKISKNADVFHDPDSTSDDKDLQDATRVAFAVQGHTILTDRDEVQTMADDTAEVYVWEPNFNNHSAFAIADMLNLYGVSDYTLIEDYVESKPIPYSGVREVISAPGIALEDTNATDTPASFGEVNTTTNARYIYTPKRTSLASTGRVASTDLGTGAEQLVLEAGITKVRVYMWIEGQDFDCGDAASGTDLRFDLILTTQGAE